jgi:hypothetical protein
VPRLLIGNLSIFISYLENFIPLKCKTVNCRSILLPSPTAIFCRPPFAGLTLTPKTIFVFKSAKLRRVSGGVVRRRGANFKSECPFFVMLERHRPSIVTPFSITVVIERVQSGTFIFEKTGRNLRTSISINVSYRDREPKNP